MYDEVGDSCPFVQMLTDTLWYINGQYHKFGSRCKHAKVPPILDMFASFNKGGENNEGWL